MRKFFFIARKDDLIQELSLEQMFEEASDKEFQRYILHDFDKAMQFIKLRINPTQQPAAVLV